MNWWTVSQLRSDVDGALQFYRNFAVGKFSNIVVVIGHGSFSRPLMWCLHYKIFCPTHQGMHGNMQVTRSYTLLRLAP